MQWCEMHGDVVVAQMSEREHLSVVGRALASKYVPSLKKWSVGSVFSLSGFVASRLGRCVGCVFAPSGFVASRLGRCVACRTFQSYRIGFERKPFLLRGSVEKCATRNIKFRMC